MTRLERLAAALAVVTTRPPIAVASAPLELRNPLNGRGLGVSRGARMASNARRQKERRAGVMLAARMWKGTWASPEYYSAQHCVVLTRISPKAFDSDNNEAALKSVRDGMAEAWGIDDADPRVTWVCDWRKGPSHVVEAALWAVPEKMAVPVATAVEVTDTGGPVRWVRSPAPSHPEFDASDYERPRVVVHGGLIQRREVRATPAYIRAKGGL